MGPIGGITVTADRTKLITNATWFTNVMMMLGLFDNTKVFYPLDFHSYPIKARDYGNDDEHRLKPT